MYIILPRCTSEEVLVCILSSDTLVKSSLPLPTADLMSDLWIPDKIVKRWVLPRRPMEESEVQRMVCGHFQMKYDKVQAMIRQVGCMDELLSGNNHRGNSTFFLPTALNCACNIIILCPIHPILGMLSKSKGQILRVATVVHILFNMDSPTSISNEVSESSVIAADCFVDLCLCISWR